MHRQKPRWVIVRENEEARAAAHRAEMRDPFTVINKRVKASAEYADLMVQIEAEVVAFFQGLPLDEEEAVTILREKGGRTAILAEIIKRLGSQQVHLSEIYGYAPLSNFVSIEQARVFANQGLTARQGAA